MRIVYHVISAPSPLGLLFAAATEKGLRYLKFMDRRSLKSVRSKLEPENPGAVWEHSVRELEPVARQIAEYLNGERRRFDLRLDPVGSEFQVKVWSELASIGFGETRSYGQIADAIGEPRAARAVGLANNQNPLPIVVPCHRVIGADGKLVGYAGGVARKKYLLDLEKRYDRLAPTDGSSVIAALHRVVPKAEIAARKKLARRKPAPAAPTASRKPASRAPRAVPGKRAASTPPAAIAAAAAAPRAVRKPAVVAKPAARVVAAPATKKRATPATGRRTR